jgi:putative membrane protein
MLWLKIPTSEENSMRNICGVIAVAAALSLVHFANAAELDRQDKKFMSEMAQGLMSEVKLGEMAEKQGQDQRVKEFGKRMVEDHGRDLQELKRLASQKNVTLPDAPNKEQRAEAAKLSKLSGKDFDKEYVKYEVKDHQHDVEETGKEIKTTTDPDLKKFASAEHDTVSTHKKLVDELQARVGQ